LEVDATRSRSLLALLRFLECVRRDASLDWLLALCNSSGQDVLVGLY
jgi:hypothetical protein